MTTEEPRRIAPRAAIGLSLILVSAAFAHRMRFGSPSYVTSPFAPLEFACVTLLLLFVLTQPIVALAHLLRRRDTEWRRIVRTIVVCIAGLIAAFGIDPALLLYAT